MFSVILITQNVLASQVNVIVDGNELFVKGQIVDNRTLVPVREIAEALGAQVIWDFNSQEVKLYKPIIDITPSGYVKAEIMREVSLKVGDDKIYINGIEAFNLDVPAQIINEKTMIPVRSVSQCLEATVSWDNSTNTVNIKKSLNDSYSDAQLENILIKVAEAEVLKDIYEEKIDISESDQQISEKFLQQYGLTFIYDYPLSSKYKVGIYQCSPLSGIIGDMVYDLSEFDETIKGTQLVNGLTITNMNGEIYFSLNELKQLGLIE